MEKKKETVFVGVSGGVDSSVVAYILKKQGYDVQGIFVKTWAPDWLPCTWVDEKRDAMRVCAHLDIPFHFLDASEEYEKGVAEYMINEYKAGRTPNPDVLCNRVIKFGAMWAYTKAHGADFVATGHYARTDGEFLYKGVDDSKDQSYFLWMITKEELSHIFLPIGDLQKKDVRKIARHAGLFTNTKKDSQGICFLGEVDMHDFLLHYIEEKLGDVLNEHGEKIGSHTGVWFYTIGTRHGFTIEKKTPHDGAYYVIAKDIEQNTITVSQDPAYGSQASVEQIGVNLREANYFVDSNPEKIYTAQIRYHGELYLVQLDGDTVYFKQAMPVIPLGQSLVLYDGDTLIGGGIIDTLVMAS
ncbi:MAG: tRNA 2-thiouridine(34) synthase MnmA [bacterium]